MRLPSWIPRGHTIARLVASWQAVTALGDGASVLVSHGPRPTMYGALMARRRLRYTRHLAFSFNFTDLPVGVVRKLMVQAFPSVERFVVFSNIERELYAEYFNLPINRIDMLYWSVQPPSVDRSEAPLEPGDYICAIGSQARDYATLLHAMRRLPKLRLVVVAAPENLVNIEIPTNVSVHTNIPHRQAMNILGHCRFMVLPLRDSRVPCGLVTLVSAMHLGKAIISTESAGLLDYVKPGVNALTYPARDHVALAGAMQAMHDDPEISRRLGVAGQLFARTHCVEERVVEYFHEFLRTGRLRET